MKRQSSAPASNRVYFPHRQRHVLSPHSSLNDLLTASKSMDPDKNVYRRTRGSNFSPSRPKSSPSRPINLNGKSKSTGELDQRRFSFDTCLTESLCADAHDVDDEFNRNIRKSPWLVANTLVETTPEYDEYSDYWLNRSSRSSTAPTVRTGNIFRSRSNSFGTSSTLPIIRGSSNETSRSRSTSPSHSPLSESSLLHNSHLQSNQKQPARFSSGLGDIYSNANAMNAYKAKKLNSQSLQDASQLRILFLNRTNRDLVLCWVSFDHTLHHYRELKPSRSTTIMGGIGSINTSSSYLDTRIKGGMHKEQSYLGHSFVIGTCSTVQKDETEAHIDHEYDDSDHELQPNQGCWNPFQKREIVNDDILKIDKSKIGKIIAAYRPKRLTANDEECKKETCLHIVTITEELAFMPQEREKQRFFSSSFGSKEDIVSSEPQIMYHVTATQCKLDDTPLDTSNKEYEEMNLGGWRVLCEKDLFSTLPKNTGIFHPMGRSSKKSRKKDKERTRSEEETLLKKVKHRIEMDLIAAAKKLPPNACEFLKETTPVWINRSQMYGPRVAPIRGVGMCFHPGKEWLSKNGMSEKKSGGVELYEAGKYLDDCDLWHGMGGVMLHEFSHAYHAKCIKNGYDNQEIIDCYNAAMEEKLYDCVRVHNCQGNCDERRAYAATNPMEYFAELSAAFLGGTGSEKDLEFNKWFPFNRKQIKEHDPRAYKLLKKVWGVKDDDAKLDLSKQ
jgi:hypothetical protein